MRAKKTIKKFLIIIALFFLAGGFYFWNDLVYLYQRLTNEINIVQNKLPENLIEEIKTEVIAPPPLRVIKEITGQTVLTTKGVIIWTNVQRVNSGLPPLKENSQLAAAALAKVKDMFEKQYFEHESPTGIGPADLADSVDYEFILIGENLAMGNYEDDESLVQAWMDSPGHRANILNKNFQEIGVAVMKKTFEGRTTWLAVQEFGLPLSVCQQPDPSLKNQININESLLNSLILQIEAARTDFNIVSRRDPIYVQKIQIYNDLVNEYNNLVVQSRSLISQYNSQVNAFNECTASF